MGTKSKVFIFTFCFGLVLTLGVGAVNAAGAPDLQPAASVIYDQDLTVNGTGSFSSIKVGKQGVGGVTFFNGSIINATTGDNDYNNPITFADNVRIDGVTFRGQNPGAGDNKPFQIMDDLYVEGGLTGGGSVVINDDLEVTETANFSKTVTVTDINGSGVISEDNLANGAVSSAKIADGSVSNGDLAGGIAASKIAGTALTQGSAFSGDVSGAYSNLQLGGGVVGSGEITNGAIMNDDINAGAGISPGKISGTAWTSTNDGETSGLDADTVDGYDVDADVKIFSYPTVPINQIITSTSFSGGTCSLRWDAAGGDVFVDNSTGDWCDYWRLDQGVYSDGAIATSATGIVCTDLNGANDNGCEVHFGQADDGGGYASVWIQYANTRISGHYITTP